MLATLLAEPPVTCSTRRLESSVLYSSSWGGRSNKGKNEVEAQRNTALSMPSFLLPRKRRASRAVQWHTTQGTPAFRQTRQDEEEEGSACTFFEKMKHVGRAGDRISSRRSSPPSPLSLSLSPPALVDSSGRTARHFHATRRRKRRGTTGKTSPWTSVARAAAARFLTCLRSSSLSFFLSSCFLRTGICWDESDHSGQHGVSRNWRPAAEEDNSDGGTGEKARRTRTQASLQLHTPGTWSGTAKRLCMHGLGARRARRSVDARDSKAEKERREARRAHVKENALPQLGSRVFLLCVARPAALRRRAAQLPIYVRWR